jgi:hypothetical protein
MTDEIDLDQSADVLWIPVDLLPTAGISGGEQRHFSTLRDAIVFTMENLPASDSATAWITLRDGSLDIEQIERLYQRLRTPL